MALFCQSVWLRHRDGKLKLELRSRQMFPVLLLSFAKGKALTEIPRCWCFFSDYMVANTPPLVQDRGPNFDVPSPGYSLLVEALAD